MSLNDFIALTDDKLKAKFEAKAPDMVALRKPIVKALKGAIDQFQNGKTKVPNRMWRVNDDIVKLTPKYQGKPLHIRGQSEFLIPAERFVDGVNKLIAGIEAGELDQTLSTFVGNGAPAKASGTRTLSDTSRLNIRVGGFRRGGKSDAEIEASLKAEGVPADQIKAALAYKRPSK